MFVYRPTTLKIAITVFPSGLFTCFKKDFHKVPINSLYLQVGLLDPPNIALTFRSCGLLINYFRILFFNSISSKSGIVFSPTYAKFIIGYHEINFYDFIDIQLSMELNANKLPFLDILISISDKKIRWTFIQNEPIQNSMFFAFLTTQNTALRINALI